MISVILFRFVIFMTNYSQLKRIIDILIVHILIDLFVNNKILKELICHYFLTSLFIIKNTTKNSSYPK